MTFRKKDTTDTDQLVGHLHISQHTVNEAKKWIELCASWNYGKVERFIRDAIRTGKKVGRYRLRNGSFRDAYRINFKNKGESGWSYCVILLEMKYGLLQTVTCLSRNEFEHDVKVGTVLSAERN